MQLWLHMILVKIGESMNQAPVGTMQQEPFHLFSLRFLHKSEKECSKGQPVMRCDC